MLWSVRTHFRLVQVFTAGSFCWPDEWSPRLLCRVLRPQCWASEVPRPQKFLVLTQVEAWNSFTFLYISYKHSLKTAWCKRCANSFNASARWLWFILFVLVAWCWPSESFRIWRTLYLNFWIIFTCAIYCLLVWFFQFLGIIGKGVWQQCRHVFSFSEINPWV